MSEGKNWTPGPWRVGTPGPNGCYTVGTDEGLMVAMVAHSINHSDQSTRALGDTNLIATSPRMYDALEMMVDALKTSGVSNGAIRQAEGFAKQVMAEARGEVNGND